VRRPKIDIDGKDAAWLIPWANRQLARFKKLFKEGKRQWKFPAGEEVTIWWGLMRDKIRIIAAGTKLAFGVHPDTAAGIVALYSGKDVPATLVRLEPTQIRVWSKDGRVGLNRASPSEQELYREGELMLTLPRAQSVSVFSMPDYFTSTFPRSEGQISDSGAVVVVSDRVIPDVSTGSPGGYSLAKFAVYRPAVVVGGIEITPHSYLEIDPGMPPISDMALGTISTYDGDRGVFYIGVTSLKHAGSLRLRTRQVALSVYANPYDATEIYVAATALMYVSVAEHNGTNSRAWELVMRAKRIIYRYRLTTDAGGLYQVGTWEIIDSQVLSDRTRTIIDRSWVSGGEGESDVGSTATVDGVLTCFTTSVTPIIDLTEPWFRVSGTAEVALHETFGVPSQTNTNPYTLEDSPLIEIIRYGATTYPALATQRILLSGTEFVTGIGVAEGVGERVANLIHLGFSRRALFTAVLGGAYKWLQPDGSFITLGNFSKVSLEANRAIEKRDFADPHSFWVDGINKLTVPGNTYAILLVSFDKNEEFVVNTATTGMRVAKLQISPISGLWEVALGDYVPSQINGVVTDFGDPISLTPILTQPDIRP